MSIRDKIKLDDFEKKFEQVCKMLLLSYEYFFNSSTYV